MKKRIIFSIVIILILVLAFFYDCKPGDKKSPGLNPYVYEEHLESGDFLCDEKSIINTMHGENEISTVIETQVEMSGEDIEVINSREKDQSSDSQTKETDELENVIRDIEKSIEDEQKEEIILENEKEIYIEEESSEGEINNEIILNENYCFLSIKCNTILDNIEMFDEEKIYLLNEDGIIFEEQIVYFEDGESAFDILKREMINNKIHLEFNYTPLHNSVYIEGINNIYEFDCGELSGWMYSINGKFPNYGCSSYIIETGDKIEFVYTCDLGKDVSGGIKK